MGQRSTLISLSSDWGQGHIMKTHLDTGVYPLPLRGSTQEQFLEEAKNNCGPRTSIDYSVNKGVSYTLPINSAFKEPGLTLLFCKIAAFTFV